MLANSGDGVGLYRTEYLFLTSPTAPTEDDQFASMKRAVEMLAGKPLTIRTLDLVTVSENAYDEVGVVDPSPDLHE